MSLESWFLIFLALFLLFPFHAAADVPDQLDPTDDATIETVADIDAPPETDDSLNQEDPSDSYDDSDPDDESTEPSTFPVVVSPDYQPIIEDSTSAIVHAVLYGSFLICGTLVGIFLLRGRYGT